KVAYSECLARLAKEGKFYRDHVMSSPFHGNGLPLFFGCYGGALTWTETPRSEKFRSVKVTCLLTQFCGFPTTFVKDPVFRPKAIELLLKLHKYGIYHGLITAHTKISNLEGAPFIHDLIEAEMHECPDKDIEVTGEILDIDVDKLQCVELKEVLDCVSFLVYPLSFDNNATIAGSTLPQLTAESETPVINISQYLPYYGGERGVEYWYLGNLLTPNASENSVDKPDFFIKMAIDFKGLAYPECLVRFAKEGMFYRDHVMNSPFHGNGLPRFYGCYDGCLTLEVPGSQNSTQKSHFIGVTCVLVQYWGYPTTFVDDPIFRRVHQIRALSK
ncbi:hypothetical protein H0H93_011172, partial [Arthromyces matolae]